MNYFFKHLLSFLFIGFVTTIVFILYLKTTSYSGGEIGMAPFAIALYCITVIGITSIIILLLKIIKYKISILKSSILFSIIYLLLLTFYFHSNPFNTNEYLSDLNFWSFFSEVISVFILNSTAIFRRKSNS